MYATIAGMDLFFVLLAMLIAKPHFITPQHTYSASR